VFFFLAYTFYPSKRQEKANECLVILDLSFLFSIEFSLENLSLEDEISFVVHDTLCDRFFHSSFLNILFPYIHRSHILLFLLFVINSKLERQDTPAVENSCFTFMFLISSFSCCFFSENRFFLLFSIIHMYLFDTI
jgi:hypothetical protein